MRLLELLEDNDIFEEFDLVERSSSIYDQALPLLSDLMDGADDEPFGEDFWHDNHDWLHDQYELDDIDDMFELMDENEELKQLYDREYERYLLGRIQDAYNRVLYQLDGDGKTYVILHRMITAPADWHTKIAERPLGVYWSYDEHSAEAHWGSTGQTYYLMKSKAPLGAIDWATTVAQNAHPVYEDEAEIKLIEGSVVELLSVSVGGEELEDIGLPARFEV